MRQKRTYVTLLLILSILCLGIAYAAITSQTLTISGQAAVSGEDTPVNVIFTNAEVTSEPYKDTVEATISDPKTTATINVSDFKKQGDSATIEYTITNQHTDMAVTLENAEVILTGEGKDDGVASGWFEVTCTIPDKELAKNNAEGNAAEASSVATVTVTLKETPVTEPQEAAAKDSIEINIVANPVETNVASN